MYCPNPECPHRIDTGEPAEYRSGTTACNECGSALVDTEPALPEGEAIEFEKFVSVFDVPNAALVPIVDSLLQQAGIRFFFKGVGSNLDFVSGPVKVWVEEDRADEARELLDQAGEPSESDFPGEDDEERGPDGFEST